VFFEVRFVQEGNLDSDDCIFAMLENFALEQLVDAGMHDCFQGRLALGGFESPLPQHLSVDWTALVADEIGAESLEDFAVGFAGSIKKLVSEAIGVDREHSEVVEGIAHGRLAGALNTRDTDEVRALRGFAGDRRQAHRAKRFAHT
jgi:hypothetical protein